MKEIVVVIWPAWGDMTPVEVYNSVEDFYATKPELGYLLVRKKLVDGAWIDDYATHGWER